MSQTDPAGDSRYLIAQSQGPREEQQDAAICLYDDAEGTALLVIGDGVGGRSGGRIASQTLAALASEMWKERKGKLSNPEEDLGTLCRGAHERINGEGSKLGISPRTTVVALYLTPTCACWAHSGDSRLYHFRAGQLIERTEDHSLLEMMVQRGAVKEEDMGIHPDQGTLLQSLGGEEYVTPSMGTATITHEDGFLLCTDGFWERTKPDEMRDLVFAPVLVAGELLTRAVDRAIERNGPKGDNVTVALALPGRQITASAASLKLPRGLLIGVVVLFLLAIVLLYWPNGKKDGAEAAVPAPTAVAPSAKPGAPVDAAPARPAVVAPTETSKGSPGNVQIRETSFDEHTKSAN